MTDGNRGDLQFEIVTPKVVGEERTICALPPDEAVAGQYRGECMLPEPHSGQHNHDFTARLKIRPNGKKSVYFYFGNRESRHNGEGHTGDQ
jgi:hypothetical protein